MERAKLQQAGRKGSEKSSHSMKSSLKSSQEAIKPLRVQMSGEFGKQKAKL
jgi:hypothetical protein